MALGFLDSDFAKIVVPILFVFEMIVVVAVVGGGGALSSQELANILLIVLILTTLFTGVFSFLSTGSIVRNLNSSKPPKRR